MTDAEWYCYRIGNAKTLEELDDISWMIQYDKWENSQYTQDQRSMQSIRQAWARRKQEIKNASSPSRDAKS